MLYVTCLTDGTPNTWILILFPACLFDNFLWKYVENYGHLIVQSTKEEERKRRFIPGTELQRSGFENKRMPCNNAE